MKCVVKGAELGWSPHYGLRFRDFFLKGTQSKPKGFTKGFRPAIATTGNSLKILPCPTIDSCKPIVTLQHAYTAALATGTRASERRGRVLSTLRALRNRARARVRSVVLFSGPWDRKAAVIAGAWRVLGARHAGC
jgi:hypothetical protein